MPRGIPNKIKPVRKSRATKASNASKTAAQKIINDEPLVDRTVTCRFAQSTKSYAYLTSDPSIIVGDLVVVISPYPNAGTFSHPKVARFPTIVQVSSVEETAESITKATKQIVCKIDLERVVELQERHKAIQLLDARIAKATEAALEQIQLQQLKALSPELDALIQQRNAL